LISVSDSIQFESNLTFRLRSRFPYGLVQADFSYRSRTVDIGTPVASTFHAAGTGESLLTFLHSAD